MIKNFPIKLDEFRTRFQVTFRACRSSEYSLAMDSLQLLRNGSFKILVMQDTISFMGSTAHCRYLFSALPLPTTRKEQTVVWQNMLVTPRSFKERVEV